MRNHPPARKITRLNRSRPRAPQSAALVHRVRVAPKAEASFLRPQEPALVNRVHLVLTAETEVDTMTIRQVPTILPQQFQTATPPQIMSDLPSIWRRRALTGLHVAGAKRAVPVVHVAGRAEVLLLLHSIATTTPRTAVLVCLCSR